mgnify:CR=1 FL=1|tara:strand:+ start:11374 stop:11946 length:573 start_codon:yes stop_codon:yes gene_type:complete
MTQTTIQKITKDMLIIDMIEKYPQAVDTLMSTGVQCVGCGAATQETIEQGLMAHGMTSSDVEEIVVDLNKAVKEAPKVEKKSGEALIVTEKAVDKLKQIKKEQKKEDCGLRVLVMPGGCSGFQYGFDFEDKKQDGDTVLEVKGQKFFVDKQSLEMLHGSTVDYVESLEGAGFKIENPNAKKGCGCGKSFR